MEHRLYDYFEGELRFLREMGKEFAEKYPGVASRLILGEEDHPDPHVERLLEGVAFLAARVHLKIDDDFPEITSALLNVVYPHYLRPVPSMSVVEFHLDPQAGKLTSGFAIKRGSMLQSPPIDGHPCKFTTCYDTTLWPLEVSAAEWRTPEKLDPPAHGAGASAVIRLEIRCAQEAVLDKLAIERLRFYLSGDNAVVDSLYEVLLNNCSQILVRDPDDRKRAPVRLPVENLRAAGFEENEAMLPYPKRSFDGYRLLQEYFAFPRKFQFIDLDGLEKVVAAGFKNRLEFLFFLAPFEGAERWEKLEGGTRPEVFRLACTPVINLFQQTAEPILLKHTQYEYPIVPDARRSGMLEVFSVEDVVSVAPGAASTVRYEPFYSFRHSDDRKRKQAFWYTTRREVSWRKDGGTELFLTLADLSGRPVVPDAEAITVRLRCSNRDLPSRLPFGPEAAGFELVGGGPIRRIAAIEKPTPSFPCPTGRAAFWRLISHLSLNHLSLVAEGGDALQEILQLYNCTGSVFADRLIRKGIRSVASRPVFARVVLDHGISFARGTLVEIGLDEEEFAGAGVFLFSSVLERFLGMYVSLNSFSQLEVRTTQRREALRRWPPRAGRKILM